MLEPPAQLKLALRLLALLLLVLASGGCTLQHSKQALSGTEAPPPAPQATFIQEEDSGVSLFGLFELAQPDHYAVLIERARRRYRCSAVHHAQLDFFTDHWILIAFPISRVTLMCDPPKPRSEKPAPAAPSGAQPKAEPRQ